MVEIYARTPAGEGWDFCVDDLVVEFVGRGDEEEEGEGGRWGRQVGEVATMHVEIDVE